jgi:hypothetical protein
VTAINCDGPSDYNMDLDLAPPPEQIFETYEALEAAAQSFAKHTPTS